MRSHGVKYVVEVSSVTSIIVFSEATAEPMSEKYVDVGEVEPLVDRPRPPSSEDCGSGIEHVVWVDLITLVLVLIAALLEIVYSRM